MKLESAIDILKLHFSGNPNAILVCGNWGIGKSYFIRKFLDTKSKEDPKFKHLFVSAFNIESVAEFRKSLGLEYLTKFVTKKNASALLSGSLRILDSIPYINKFFKNIDSNIGEIGYQSIGNATIWIDDLERCMDQKLIGLILGEVFSLVELKKCKVIIAANTEQIETEKGLKSALEKVCTSQFTFKRDRDEIYSIGLGKYSNDQELIDLLDKTNCCNLRILFRIARTADLLLGDVKEIHTEIKTQILKTIAIAAIAKYGEDEKLNDIHALSYYDVKYHSTEQGKRLHELGYYSSDDLDKNVITFIADGSIEIGAFHASINENTVQENCSKAKNEYSRLVSSIFQNFGITSDVILKKMSKFIEDNKDYLDVYIYDNLIKVLMNARQSAIVPRILEIIPQEFKLETSDNQFSYKNRVGFEDVIYKRITWIHPEQPNNLFEETVLKLARSNGWNETDLIIIASYTPEMLVKYLLEDANDNGATVAGTMLQFGELKISPQNDAIGRNIIAALETIKSLDNPTAAAICDSFSDRIQKIKSGWEPTNN
jgi:hypothetical protein